MKDEAADKDVPCLVTFEFLQARSGIGAVDAQEMIEEFEIYRAEIEEFAVAQRVAVVAQTTQSSTKFAQVVAAVVPRARDIKVANTICDATSQRQQAALDVAREVDLMLVIGGRHSANTTRLAELCAAIGTPTHHVESPDEIKRGWLQGVARVGVTGGASTPVAAIADTVARVEQLAGEGE